MKMFVKEMLLNICLYIFPLIFIISGISGGNVMLQVGVILAGIISLLMILIYVLYFITHNKNDYINYRKYLLLCEILILLICFWTFIRK